MRRRHPTYRGTTNHRAFPCPLLSAGVAEYHPMLDADKRAREMPARELKPQADEQGHTSRRAKNDENLKQRARTSSTEAKNRSTKTERIRTSAAETRSSKTTEHQAQESADMCIATMRPVR
jgi:hypothetical protein